MKNIKSSHFVYDWINLQMESFAVNFGTLSQHKLHLNYVIKFKGDVLIDQI